MQQKVRWGFGWVTLFTALVGGGVPCFALEVVFPPAGANLEVGGTYTIQVHSSPGEELVEVGMPFDDVFTFNPDTGMFEWVEHIRQDIRLGPDNWDIYAFDQKKGQIELRHPVVYVLPPTTVVVGINALVKNRKDAILKIYRTATGELVLDDDNGKIDSSSRSAGRIDVGGRYSDGVNRGVSDESQLTYTSTNEKVAIVIPPSEKTGGETFVTAVGRGTANIIVRYGSFENILFVKVWECPYELKEKPFLDLECKR